MQQEKNRKYYDVIVIGASVPGVFFAIEQKKLGNDVLLINKYGFPGGYLTESLSILQMLERNSLFPEIENWLSDLEEDNGLLFQASTTNIFNPENVKISLQKLLQNHEIDMLFHVFPKNIEIQKRKDNKFVLWGKEGAIEFYSGYVFDATENFLLNLFFEEGENNAMEYKSNLITTEVMRENIVDINGDANVYQLADGRCFMQLPFQVSNSDFYESDAQKKIDEISKHLKKRKCRVQVLAPQSEITFNIKQGLYLDQFEEYFGAFVKFVDEPVIPHKILELTDKLLKLNFT